MLLGRRRPKLPDPIRKVDPLLLPVYGIRGNDHGMIYENNSDDVLKVVLDWLIRLEGLQYRRH
ncbi:hypothetical protein HDE78_001960 [Rhodanobacter sp. K2T2]|nr:hypothetical protein [Rhodanobacter sp. K2T2]